MGRRLAIYDVNNTSLIAMGIPIEDGKGDPYVEFEFPDDFEYDEGADGLVVRCRNTTGLVSVKLNLKQSSTHHAELSLLRGVDMKEGNGAGVAPFLYKDNNGLTTIPASRSWIHKLPSWQVAKVTAQVTWDLRILVDPSLVVLGGHVLED